MSREDFNRDGIQSVSPEYAAHAIEQERAHAMNVLREAKNWSLSAIDEREEPVQVFHNSFSNNEEDFIAFFSYSALSAVQDLAAVMGTEFRKVLTYLGMLDDHGIGR